MGIKNMPFWHCGVMAVLIPRHPTYALETTMPMNIFSPARAVVQLTIATLARIRA
jgi:hypothetical protein